MDVVLPRRLTILNTEELANLFVGIPGFPSAQETVDIGATGVSFVEPTGLAGLSATLRLLVEPTDQDCEINWQHPADRNVRNYLARMDFLTEFGIDVSHGRRAAEGRFVELHAIDFATRNVSNVLTSRLCSVAEANWDVNESAVKLMSYGLGECIDNVVAHSASPIGGFTCAQAYRNRDAMQYAVSDSGIGIRASLAERYELSSDAEAIKLALEKHITGKLTGHAGEGLFVVREMVAANGGVLIVHSGNALYQLDRGQRTGQIAEVPPFPGTVVGIELALRPDRSLADLFDVLFPEDAQEGWLAWPMEEGDEDAEHSR
ncbi:MAG: hypothetical protein ACOCX2_11465 [Armatimonadota bacterium]